MTHDLPKAMKREIRQLGAVVHERLLAAELRKLDAEFARWRSGEIDAFELGSLIHRFHEGPPRQLWLSFNTHHVGALSHHLTEALAEGTLRPEEVSEETLAFLSRK